MVSGVHVKGDSPVSVRLGGDLEFWVRTYATENDTTMGKVIKMAVQEYVEAHSDGSSAKLP